MHLFFLRWPHANHCPGSELWFEDGRRAYGQEEDFDRLSLGTHQTAQHVRDSLLVLRGPLPCQYHWPTLPDEPLYWRRIFLIWF